SADDLALLESVEAEFGTALEDGQRMFIRTQGAVWFAQASSDFAQLRALRERIVQQDARPRQLMQLFQVEQALVRAQLRRPASQSATGATASTTATVARNASGSPAAVTQGWLVATPRWELPLRPGTRTGEFEGGIAPVGLAWLSISVLLLLLAVSV